MTEQENAALRSQLEEALEALGTAKIKYPTVRHSDEKWRQIEADLKRDLATAQARIARLEEALTKLSKGNRSPGVLKIARAAIAEPQSGEK